MWVICILLISVIHHLASEELKKEIICSNLKNTSEVSPKDSCIVQESLDGSIKSVKCFRYTFFIHITNGCLPEINSKTFIALDIKSLYITQSRIGHISNDAFNGFNLSRIGFDGVPDLEMIPYAVSNTDITYFFGQNGNLKSIGTQLQNLTGLQSAGFMKNKIADVDSKAFLNCIKLEDVDLRENQIQSLDSNIFPNKDKLRVLYLNNNLLISVGELLKNYPIALEELFLANNSLSSIWDDFPSGNALTKINLDGSKHERLSNFYDRFFPHLYFLSMNNASIEEVPYIFSLMPALRILEMACNRIENIDGVFKNLPNLQLLSLDDNQITDVRNGTFSNNTKLESLSLARNSIKSLNPGPFLGLNEKCTTLDLSYNRIRSFGGIFSEPRSFMKLRFLFLSHNLLETVTEEDFRTTSLEELDLDFNRISTLRRAFVNLRYLKKLSLRSNRLIEFTQDNFPSINIWEKIILNGNPLSCDCRMKWTINTHLSVDNEAMCASPSWLQGRYVHNLTIEDASVWKENCPEECGPGACRCYTNSTGIRIKVSCANLNLTSIPQIYPKRTFSLDFSNNRVEQIPKDLSQLFPNAQEMDFRRNRLRTLSGLTFPVNLNVLYLSENNISRFPSEYQDSMDLTNISLSGNPWICDCQTDSFRKWILENRRMISDVNDIRCSRNEINGNLNGRKIASLQYLQLCPVKVSLYASISIGVLAILLGVAGGLLGFNRHKISIKVWLYTHGMCLRCVKEEDLDGDKDFDAFIAFSSQDQEFVTSLIKELENKPPGYRLCVHYRDFIAGRPIVENISQAVTASKKTIVLLSRDFLESAWGMLEFREAHRQTMEEKVNRIIVVLVGELTATEEIPKDLRTYMLTATFLKWNENSYWDKLRYAMPKTPVKQNMKPFRINDVEHLLLEL